MTKKQIKQDFDKYTANKYLYFDCVIFGEERVEIKAVEKGTWLPMMITYSLVDEGNAVDWANPSVRKFNPKKDW